MIKKLKRIYENIYYKLMLLLTKEDVLNIKKHKMEEELRKWQ